MKCSHFLIYFEILISTKMFRFCTQNTFWNTSHIYSSKLNLFCFKLKRKLYPIILIKNSEFGVACLVHKFIWSFWYCIIEFAGLFIPFYIILFLILLMPFISFSFRTWFSVSSLPLISDLPDHVLTYNSLFPFLYNSNKILKLRCLSWQI